MNVHYSHFLFDFCTLAGEHLRRGSMVVRLKMNQMGQRTTQPDLPENVCFRARVIGDLCRNRFSEL
jgi:hypothetical protein